MHVREKFGKFYGDTRTRGHVRSGQHGRRMGPVLVCCCPPPSRDARERARPARPADCRRATTSGHRGRQVVLSLPQSTPPVPRRRHVAPVLAERLLETSVSSPNHFSKGGYSLADAADPSRIESACARPPATRRGVIGWLIPPGEGVVERGRAALITCAGRLRQYMSNDSWSGRCKGGRGGAMV